MLDGRSGRVNNGSRRQPEVCPVAALGRNRIVFWAEKSVKFLEEATTSEAPHYGWRYRGNQIAVFAV
jgi:hypothetical protein